MSRLSRLLPSLAAARRSYSIFSSKSGGGRYFNSAKSSKVIAPSTSKSSPAPAANVNNAGPSAAPDSPQPNPTDELTSSSSQQTAVDTRHSYTVHEALPSAPALSSPSIDFSPLPPHPTMKPNELVLHRFFALHRPCLLLNQPATTLFESAPPTTSSSTSDFAAPPASLGTIDDPPMASPEADADAARQLSRAIVMNRVGNLTDWGSALARLGWHEVKEPVPPVPAGISMDSVKRKRRKKMKQHKLKKRRRLQRAKRLRLGK
ncbi:uncharacterized protein FOMMEDRAFT_166137 [Fomitiporia mediterranea MF3/22]|uniref:uncharacterized protein n=1 Tax=Fomitiporia mediterranea (strain MF3/22) TaxID=694068 RepID=UPI0004409AE3|nr:uncharacterized protein FOMMEDRAFT_166137 [Fomitiporia mediterranea MF3/22]EJD05805.1 hypothetical protein FOMMEDRAFT_166137 [Fomitiporia mediterranea MF3/22]